MTKFELIARINKIAEQSNTANGEVYTVTIKEWASENGKSRTYFKIARTWRNKYTTIDCGYFDNVTGEYVKGNTNLSSANLYDYDGNKKITL